MRCGRRRTSPATLAGNAPLSIAGAKLMLNGLAMGNLDPAAAQAVIDRAGDSEDYREGRRAFAEKREAGVQGTLERMKPAAFDYVVADSVDAAVAALAGAGGDAKIIAGGQSLVPMLNFRLLRPSILVDINRIPGLAFIEDDGNAIRVGALTRHHRLETSPVIAQHLPVLASAMMHVAHLAIRNRGTIGGSLSHADPAAELPMMALLLDAELEITSASRPAQRLRRATSSSAR